MWFPLQNLGGRALPSRRIYFVVINRREYISTLKKCWIYNGVNIQTTLNLSRQPSSAYLRDMMMINMKILRLKLKWIICMNKFPTGETFQVDRHGDQTRGQCWFNFNLSQSINNLPQLGKCRNWNAVWKYPTSRIALFDCSSVGHGVYPI